ncbi:MAG: carbon storage regulator [Dehalococcoidia bacterium]|nr:carbon storage regulator [Dehalococcoidia bacterium]MCA9849678.1 carbon storage regulator [Dehalococcoidia bacterium]MCA9855868.1 carbon storage regulator [Dehalococcoidia bacterium]MCB9492059.1 carbon storage regulator [Dehalococcoidia bacterium]
MLILTRKAEQGIVIDGKVVVRLLAIDGERVKIGIEAPRSVSVLREELLVEVADQNQEAARIPGTVAGRQGLTQAFRGFERPPQASAG